MILRQHAGAVANLLFDEPRGLLPPLFARLHPRFRTPHVTTAITGIVVAIASGLFPISVLGQLVSMGTLLAFAIVCTGVLILRQIEPDTPRPFKTPGDAVGAGCRHAHLHLPDDRTSAADVDQVVRLARDRTHDLLQLWQDASGRDSSAVDRGHCGVWRAVASRSLPPMRGCDQTFDETQHTIDRQRQCRGRKRARQNHSLVGERESGDDRFAQPARADERRECRRSNSDHRGSSYSGHDDRCGKRKPDPHQPLRWRRAQCFRGGNRIGIGIANSRKSAAGDRIERVQPERHQRRRKRRHPAAES